MCHLDIPVEVEDVDDFAIALGLQILSRNFFRQEFYGMREIPNHLRFNELSSCPSILRHFKHPDSPGTRRGQLHSLRQAFGQVMDHTGAGR